MDSVSETTERAAQDQLDQIRPELLGVHQSDNGNVSFSMNWVNKLLIPPQGVDRIQGAYKGAVVRHNPSRPLPSEQERVQPHWMNALSKIVTDRWRRLDKAASAMMGDTWNPCVPDWTKLRMEIAKRTGHPHSDLDRLGLPALTQWAEQAASAAAADVSEAIANDDAMLAPSALAKMFSRKPEALRKQLDRYRKDNHSGWTENEARGPRDAKYLYRLGTVRHIIEACPANVQREKIS